MAYVEPTAATFKARFPEFAAVSDTLIELIIAEAAPQVGTSWLERDRAPAIMYLVAHLLAEQGYPGGTGGAVGITGPVKRRKTGDVEVEFAGVAAAISAGSGAAASSLWGSTAYGRQFYIYMRRNFSPIAVV